MIDRKIIQIIPADNWYVRFIEKLIKLDKDSVETDEKEYGLTAIPLTCWALYTEKDPHDGKIYTDVDGMMVDCDGVTIFCDEPVNFCDYYTSIGNIKFSKTRRTMVSQEVKEKIKEYIERHGNDEVD